MRSEATKNSPRLGLLDTFPVDEVALHSQHHIGHHITCMIPHESTTDRLTPTVTLYRAAVLPNSGETLKKWTSGPARPFLLPQASPNTPPRHPSPLMQVIRPLACQTPFIIPHQVVVGFSVKEKKALQDPQV